MAPVRGEAANDPGGPEENDEVDQVGLAGDGQGMKGRHEKVVDEEEADRRRQQRRREAAQDSDGCHQGEVQKDVVTLLARPHRFEDDGQDDRAGDGRAITGNRLPSPRG